MLAAYIGVPEAFGYFNGVIQCFLAFFGKFT
jgi:hypothetical protein